MNIETNRLLIRPICMADKAAVFAYRADSETNKYQGWIPQDLEDVEQFIGKVAPEINVPETWFQLVIIEHETKQIIGDIGIHFRDKENQNVELGCTLAKKNQGKGYSTEALRKVLDFIFADLQKHRVIASVDPANINSIRMLKSLGFRKEAHFVESLYLDGKWVDDVIFALLAREWKTQKND